IIRGPTHIIQCLNNLKLQLESLSDLSFYTDGSVQDSNDGFPVMGFSWILDGTVHPSPLFFKGSTTLFTSSSKAENFAILTALIVCPESTNIKIYTDSQCTIDSFNRFPSTSPRRKLKQNNFLIWHAIFHIISSLKLSVQLFKIKAHSGIILNEQADQLAKDACKCKDYIKLNYTLPNLPNNLLIW